MARTTNPGTLSKIIAGLRAARQDLMARLHHIESTFADLGISAESGAPRRGRKPGRAKASRGGRRRKRRSFALSGEASVLGFVKKHGTPNAAEVNKHWSGEGRGGKADNALSKLVKTRKLKRVAARGERGGRYIAV